MTSLKLFVRASLYILLFHSTDIFGAIHVGMITRIEGDVQLLSHPTKNVKNPKGPGPHVVYEGVAYSVQPAVQGDQIKHGFVVKSGVNGKARVVYKNGDQVTVAENSAFTFKWNPKTEKDSVMEVFSGKVRYLIQKDSERSGMEVHTKSAVMGVRGTDFFVQAWSAKGGSEVSVLRGKVEVKSTQHGNEKPVEVPAGYSLAVAAPPPPSESHSGTTPAAEPALEIKKITQQELVIIQHETKVEKPKDPAASDAMTEEQKLIAAEIEGLEKKAVEATLIDIKTHEPALYAKLGKNAAVSDVDLIQQETIKKLFDEAPSAPGKNKPSLNDLEGKGDVYEKYKWK